MSAVPPIAPVSASPLNALESLVGQASQVGSPAFSSLLSNGIKDMETKVAKADELVQRFATGESVPVHQVTYALEEAKLSVELAMQVRSRLVEAYRDLMNMQL